MNKAQLIQELNIHFDKLSYWLHNQDERDFNKIFKEGKWTTAQHVKHLINSMAPVNLYLRIPRFITKAQFGTCNRAERSFEQLLEKYEAKLRANNKQIPKRFRPSSDRGLKKDILIAQLRKETDKMIHQIKKCSEAELSKYVLPHPLLGKLSFREMIQFSIFHMEHHRLVLKESYSSTKIIEDEILF